jgi:CheY-like chemotaxis protein
MLGEVPGSQPAPGPVQPLNAVPERSGDAIPTARTGTSRAAESTAALRVERDVDTIPGAGPEAGRPRRVLVVDDHADAAETLAVLLRHAGHEVVALTDGRAAVDVAPSFRPDIVILDIALADMSGFDVARELRRLPGTANADIVAVSGYGRGDQVHRAREAGFSAYCVKPLGGEALKSLLAGRVPTGL